jgi:hypothetical protein
MVKLSFAIVVVAIWICTRVHVLSGHHLVIIAYLCACLFLIYAHHAHISHIADITHIAHILIKISHIGLEIHTLLSHPTYLKHAIHVSI